MTPTPWLRRSVRAILLTDDRHVLLARFVFPPRDGAPEAVEAWALPGGGLEDDEDPEAGLRRELHEELGLADFEIGPHVWRREHLIPMRTGHDGQVDRIHLVPIERFEPVPTIGWDAMRAEFVHELRWWPIAAISAADNVRFAPRRLGELLTDLADNGPPPAPIDTGV